MKRLVITGITALSAFAIISGALLSAAHAEDSAKMSAIARLDSIKESYLASLRAEAIQTKNKVQNFRATGPATAWMVRVKSSEVNMVTNRYMKKSQDEIKIDGKTYFGTGGGMALNMAQNSTTRSAVDPITNKRVDKSEAVIMADASGRVHYFESDRSFTQFASLATPETLFGYSEPK